MKTVYTFLANGFEEIEAVTPIDMMRRAGIRVRTIGVNGKTITGAHGIQIQADEDGAEFALPEDASMVFLPGGGEGTENLKKSEMVSAVLKDAAARGLPCAAICAAPTVLQKAGLLAGKKLTSFPGVNDQFPDGTHTGAPVQVDGNIITARSAGVALPFAVALIAMLEGEQKAQETLDEVYPVKPGE